MSRSERYTVAQVVDALVKSRGVKKDAARKLGCHWATVHSYVKRYPRCQAACDEAREQLIDDAESKLFEALDNGERWAVELVLRTIGRDRGYVVPDGPPVAPEAEIVLQWPSRPAVWDDEDDEPEEGILVSLPGPSDPEPAE